MAILESLQRNGRIALIGICALVLAVPALGKETLDRVKKRGEVSVGYRIDASPFSFNTDSGAPAGYSLDLCLPVAARLAQQAGLAPDAIRYMALPVSQIEQYLRDGDLDLMCSATSDTPERRLSMGFSAPIYISAVKVLVLKSENVQSVAQLGGATVGVIDQTTAAKAVADYAGKSGIALAVIKIMAADAAMGQLKLGWIKGFARDDVLLSIQLAGAPDANDYSMLPEAISSENIAIAFSADDPAMQKLVGEVLAELRVSGAWAVAYERWFMQPIPPFNKSLNIPMSAELKTAIDQVK